jgi:DNA mismatch repair protein MutS
LERIDLDEPFIPNDLELDAGSCQIAIITGPNMAGKSTVMRQVALIQLMAQVGAFVPAQSAELSLVDRIFTRVGASDNLSRGQSTFMMEMNEAANILNNATANSLIVLDEIGRGTSTYDGISIAWAMVEHLHHLGALTLFATHYHELTQLARELPRLQNFSISIQEEGERLVFPRKLKAGEADKSYGIQVARMAGLPTNVIERAHEVMDNLTAGSEEVAVVGPPPIQRKGEADPAAAARARQQLSFLADAHPVLEKIRALELDGLSPREALEFLYGVRGNLDEGKEG